VGGAESPRAVVQHWLHHLHHQHQEEPLCTRHTQQSTRIFSQPITSAVDHPQDNVHLTTCLSSAGGRKNTGTPRVYCNLYSTHFYFPFALEDGNQIKEVGFSEVLQKLPLDSME